MEKPKQRQREDEATRKLKVESTRDKGDREDTQDLDLSEVEVLADLEVTRGKVTGEIVAKPLSPQPDDEDDVELPGLGSKLKRLAKKLRSRP